MGVPKPCTKRSTSRMPGGNEGGGNEGGGNEGGGSGTVLPGRRCGATPWAAEVGDVERSDVSIVLNSSSSREAKVASPFASSCAKRLRRNASKQVTVS